MSDENISFASSRALLSGLSQGRWSSTELVEHFLNQFQSHNGKLNAIIVDRFVEARAEAAEADQRRQRGYRAPLLGLPMTIKECIDVAGLPSTSGMPEHSDRVPDADAPVVAALKRAGAIFIGKTNLPYACDNWQANSPLYGRTNNPWDLSRTPGGSTGGGAAALASGMTPLEIGSDIGGSVRVPAAFCGVYGHRQSETLVPRSGHFPGHSLPNQSMILNVMGPLARSADDLELALDVIAGPEHGEDAAWSVVLPESRHRSLHDFRVAVAPRFDWLPVSNDVVTALNRVRAALENAGASVSVALPDGLGDLKEYHRLYCRLLRSVTSVGLDEHGRRGQLEVASDRGDQFDGTVSEALNGTPADFIQWHGMRESYREAWRQFFRDHDVLLAPITLTTAFKHVDSVRHGLDDYFRTLDVDGESVPYDYQLVYPALSTLCGQPATAFPAGVSESGLPVGLQAVGPYLEDRTTIRFAELLANEIGGFARPPGYGQ